MDPATPAVLRPIGAVLIGGQSRRFGRPKDRAELAGRALVDRALAALAPACEPLVVVTRRGGPTHPSAPHLFDRVPDAGPLGGIHSALVAARDRVRPGALCVACDLPFLTPALLGVLAEQGTGSQTLVTAPAGEGRRAFEPLCAYWSVAALEPLEAALRRGERSVWRVAEEMGVRVIPREVVAGHGAPETLFLNVNTPADHARAQELANRAGEPWGSLASPDAGARPGVGTRLATPGPSGRGARSSPRAKGDEMAHVYKSIELVGVSPQSFDDAVRNAVQRAGETVRALKWLEVVEQRGHIEGGAISEFQVKVKVWFELNGGG
jgi:molybdopterin-guanine dinucleotide biosynthesis protein A/flavin-binding protein dodecin